MACGALSPLRCRDEGRPPTRRFVFPFEGESEKREIWRAMVSLSSKSRLLVVCASVVCVCWGWGGRGKGGFEERRSQPAVPTQRRPPVRPTEEGDDERRTLVVPPRDVLLRLPLELGEVEEVVVDGPG